MAASKKWFGHPPGLETLFMIEIWERASYYGMRATLVLYMTAKIALGGLGLTPETATMIYGFYCGCVYLAPLLGGFIADRYLGARRTMVVGGIVIALGHLWMATMFLGQMPSFYGGLALIAIGTGLLKPNVSTMTSNQYAKDDDNREAGFNIVYMGINVGAMLGSLLCGSLAEDVWFKNLLTSMHFDPNSCWHWSFGVAGMGMLFGLLQYWWHRERLLPFGDWPQKRNISGNQGSAVSLTKDEWHKLYALGFLFVAFTLYCAISEQAGSSLTLFAKHLTDRSIFGFEFSAAWMGALNPFFIIVGTLVFNKLWPYLKTRGIKPGSPMKFAIGLGFVALGTVFMVPAAIKSSAGLVSPMWLVLVYLFQTIGELCLSPVGTATANKLAPKRFEGLVMGVWFLAVAIGSLIAGRIAGYCDMHNPTVIAFSFGLMAATSLAAGVLLWRLSPRVDKLIADA
jgi:POT family proton-dependent oligopeptide transporter